MRRWIAVLWQASFLVIAGVLYYLFVMPRWHELSGDWSHTLGTAGRIVAGALIGLAALPVVFTLLKTRKPEYGTPSLALSLRVWSVVLHVLAGVLIIGTAIAEIWLNLDRAGQWMFGIYGAAAAIAILGALSFYLAYLAELPPPPPKPLKAKGRTRGRGRRKTASDDDAAHDADSPNEDDDAVDDETDETVETDDETVEAPVPVAETVEAPVPVAETVEAPVPVPKTVEVPDDTTDSEDAEEATETAEEQTAVLRNQRPASKRTSRLRRRSRGGVAVED